MKGSLRWGVATALIIASASTFASNRPGGVSPAATGGALTIVSATQQNPGFVNQIVASIPLTGTTNDGSGDVVCAVIFDDGAIVASSCTTVPVGSTVNTTFTLNWNGSILQGAPGVGIDIFDATSSAAPATGTVIASIDPVLPSAFTITNAIIPTMSQWGMIIMALLLAVAATVTLRRRR